MSASPQGTHKPRAEATRAQGWLERSLRPGNDPWGQRLLRPSLCWRAGGGCPLCDRAWAGCYRAWGSSCRARREETAFCSPQTRVPTLLQPLGHVIWETLLRNLYALQSFPSVESHTIARHAGSRYRASEKRYALNSQGFIACLESGYR